MPLESNRDCVLLDRDGTINIERHYLSDPDELVLLDGAAAGMRRVQALGLRLIVVTNQSGIARGYFDEARLRAIHDRLEELLGAEGVTLDGIYHCADHPERATRRRKPGPGMIEDAARDFGFAPERAFVAGDKACDVNMGHAVSATTFLVRTGYGAKTEANGDCQPHFVVDDLTQMADFVAEITARRRAGHSHCFERQAS